MPNTWTEQTWNELLTLDVDLEGRPRPRNTDSSVDPQYEDHLLPDHTLDHDKES